MTVLPELLLAPALVGVAICVGRRWGERVSGLVSSFPAVVGPVLLIAAQEHGASFAARNASGTLFGLTTLAAFIVVYAKIAARTHWTVCLAGGWAAAIAVGVPIQWLAGRLGSAAGLLVASASLCAAYAALPAGAAQPRARPSTGGARETVLQMGLTVGLVGGLAVAAARLGPTVGGVLAALPILAAVLSTRTHRRHGAIAVVDLLRGILTGMPAFVAFCAVVGLLIVPLGTAWAFSLAVVVAIMLQATMLDPGAFVRVARAAAAGRQV